MKVSPLRSTHSEPPSGRRNSCTSFWLETAAPSTAAAAAASAGFSVQAPASIPGSPGGGETRVTRASARGLVVSTTSSTSTGMFSRAASMDRSSAEPKGRAPWPRKASTVA